MIDDVDRLDFLDQQTLLSMRGAIQHPMGPTAFGFDGDRLKVTVVLSGSDLDRSLMIAATLVKAAGCSCMTFVSHLELGLSESRQVIGHGFSFDPPEHCSWVVAFLIPDNRVPILSQPVRLSAVAPAVEIIELALQGEVESHHLVTTQIWLKDKGHAVLLA